MKTLRARFAAVTIAAMLGSIAPAHASPDNLTSAEAAANLSGLHDFDFLVGEWRVHHRRLKERLAGSHQWFEFDGTLTNYRLMEGLANIGENFFDMPGFDMPGGAYRGVGLRSYDPKSGQWASWWLDGRDPFGDLDPPAKGRFENGIGMLYADSTFQGKPIRVRVLWSRITPASARWEQSFSADGGKTWEMNWVSDFQRVK